MIYLIPGRHHLLTNGLFQTLFRLSVSNPLDALVFAVTSANHSNTRRNPVPFYQRALAIQEFGEDLPLPVLVYGIADVGILKDFVGYTLKQLGHMSEGRLNLTPSNCRVVAREPLDELYRAKGFEVEAFGGELPWNLVEGVASFEGGSPGKGLIQSGVMNHLHPASYKIWKTYGLATRAAQLFSDPLIGADGDLTETRDYTTYVRQMDDIAPLKFQETAPYLQPGRIGDIGCAVGSWIHLACKDPRLAESDFFGIEVARPLFAICEQRKANGEFANPFVFFSQKNAVSGLCFDRGSMNTLHTSSLTHEIESYGGRSDLLQFLENRYEELAPGGVWVNRDVVGPREKEKLVFLWLNKEDGLVEPHDSEGLSPPPRDESLESEALQLYLESLSTWSRFFHFFKDFRPQHRVEGIHRVLPEEGGVVVSQALAMEYLSKKDYTDNWRSEMHETFCFWNEMDWKQHLEAVGFQVSPLSRFYPNPWIIKNRFEGKAKLLEWDEQGGVGRALPWPETHMILVAHRE